MKNAPYTSAFLEACKEEDDELLKVLFERYRKIDMNTSAGIKALEKLSKESWRKDMLVQLFCTACKSSSVETIDAILKLGDKEVINGSNKYGWTGLTEACANGKEEIVGMLLASPYIDVNKENENCGSSLFIAGGNGHKSVVEMLLKRGDLDLTTTRFYNYENMDARRYAEYHKHPEIAEMIKQRQVEVRNAVSLLRNEIRSKTTLRLHA